MTLYQFSRRSETVAPSFGSSPAPRLAGGDAEIDLAALLVLRRKRVHFLFAGLLVDDDLNNGRLLPIEASFWGFLHSAPRDEFK